MSIHFLQQWHWHFTGSLAGRPIRQASHVKNIFSLCIASLAVISPSFGNADWLDYFSLFLQSPSDET
jgi:hypothetical protein